MAKDYSPSERTRMNKAMRLSLAIGFFMLGIKSYAYFLTGSAAILSDAAESVVHVFAVGFAAYSMWLSHKPADEDHTYGHDRITFFSAGFEGALIMIAALFILYQALKKIVYGFELENLDEGMLFISIATILNGGLGLYLMRLGGKYHSLVLEADGKHILTDCLTSLGVIFALILTRLTGWIYFDPILALLIGLNILWTGWRLIYSSFHGLMDRVDPSQDAQIRSLLEQETSKRGVRFHHLRHRNAGNRLIIEVHLLFSCELAICKAHELATQIERAVNENFEQPTELITHLEPLEGHDEIHNRLLGHEG
ncbi:MAG: cation transporter [Chlamydiales bacterium]|nr:cation transporter [Chlamydiales bacterium]